MDVVYIRQSLYYCAIAMPLGLHYHYCVIIMVLYSHISAIILKMEYFIIGTESFFLTFFIQNKSPNILSRHYNRQKNSIKKY